MESTFRKELEQLLNGHSKENGSNTPDFILAAFLESAMENFDKTMQARAEWYGRMDSPGQSK